MPYPCVPKLAMELQSPEMLLNMSEGKQFLDARGIKLKPGSGNGRHIYDSQKPILKVNGPTLWIQ